MIDWKNRQRRALGRDAREEVTKTYTITGPAEFMERLEKHLAFIAYLGGVGHSCVAGIDVDGDGQDRIKIRPELPRPKEDTIKTIGSYPAQYEKAV